jgi:hypothetical protein
LLDTYPSDPERRIITVLIARTRAEEMGDIPGAITMLEELSGQSLDNDTQTLVDAELERIRSLPTQPDQHTTQEDSSP